MTSVSRTESSQITVRFKLSKDPDTAAAEVRDRVARVRGRLPDAVDEPVIAKVEADATPTIWLAYTSETMGPLELTDLINRVVKPRLQTVPGVADVQIGGDRSTPCASGSTPTGWPATGSRCRTSRTRCGGRTSRCRPAASRASSASSASPRAPTSTRWRSSTRSRSRPPAATRCGCATWRAWRRRPPTSAAGCGSTACLPSAPASSATPPPTRWKWPTACAR